LEANAKLIEADRRNKLEKRMRLREMARRNQEENESQHQSVKEKRARENEEERLKAETAQRQLLEESMKIRDALRQQKSKMKAAWDTQVGHKQSNLKASKEYDNTFRTTSYFRGNESSDEEV
jgi:hypothetical protein